MIESLPSATGLTTFSVQFLALHTQASATAGFNIEQLAELAYIGNSRPDFTCIEICGADVSLYIFYIYEI